jgi:hypothetical protein
MDQQNDCVVECEIGSFEKEGHCFDCPATCTSCKNLDLCYTCERGFQLNAIDMCEECSFGCLACSEGRCDECVPTMFIGLTG